MAQSAPHLATPFGFFGAPEQPTPGTEICPGMQRQFADLLQAYFGAAKSWPK